MKERSLLQIRSSSVGIVPPDHFLLPELTAIENVMMPMRVAGVSRKASLPRAAELLARVGMEAHAEARPAKLSGEEQQRIVIARALANRPLLLLADEPAARLDSMGRSLVYDLLMELNREGQTLICATHDPELATRGGRSLHLLDGRLASGAPEQARADVTS